MDRRTFLEHWRGMRFRLNDHAVENLRRFCVDNPDIAARTLREHRRREPNVSLECGPIENAAALRSLKSLPKRRRRESNASVPIERGSIEKAAAILGLKPRKLQTMSQRGQIPGAAKLGRLWTYDLAKLRQYVDQQEAITTCQGNAKRHPDATGAAISFGAKPKFVGTASGGRLKRMIQQSQKRVAKRAKRER
jgi:hypothetical protein